MVEPLYPLFDRETLKSVVWACIGGLFVVVSGGRRLVAIVLDPTRTANERKELRCGPKLALAAAGG